MWAFIRNKIGLRRKSGYMVSQDPLFLLFFSLNRTRMRLLKAVRARQFEKDFLDSLFVMRSEVLKWCAEEFLAPPGIWAGDMALPNGGDAPKPISGRHREDEINKQLCQAIARALWDIDPQIHPTRALGAAFWSPITLTRTSIASLVCSRAMSRISPMPDGLPPGFPDSPLRHWAIFNFPFQKNLRPLGTNVPESCRASMGTQRVLVPKRGKGVSFASEQRTSPYR